MDELKETVAEALRQAQKERGAQSIWRRLSDGQEMTLLEVEQWFEDRRGGSGDVGMYTGPTLYYKRDSDSDWTELFELRQSVGGVL